MNPTRARLLALLAALALGAAGCSSSTTTGPAQPPANDLGAPKDAPKIVTPKDLPGKM